MTTGEKIKMLRLQKKMTQEDLSLLVGVKVPAIYKYENGIVVNLKRSIIEKLADALDTTPSYLLGFDDVQPPLPPPSTPNPRAAEFAELFSQLPPDRQEFVLAALRGMKKDSEN